MSNIRERSLALLNAFAIQGSFQFFRGAEAPLESSRGFPFFPGSISHGETNAVRSRRIADARGHFLSQDSDTACTQRVIRGWTGRGSD